MSPKNFLSTTLQLAILVWALFTTGCKSTKIIQKEIAKKDSTAIVIRDQAAIDSMMEIKNLITLVKSRKIDYQTFSAKIKVDYEDTRGKQPNLLANVRMIKDSVIWISAIATVFNIEAFRVLITRDSVFVLDKINKKYQKRSINYLSELTEIPFNLPTLQNLIVGNPVFFSDSVLSFAKNENKILLSTFNEPFKHLLTLIGSDRTLVHSKLDDLNFNRNRTADITYADFMRYANIPTLLFPTTREIVLSEKNKLDIQLDFKQFDFNKDIQISFTIPKNYKKS